ncbi:DNA-binding response OmpR family regulator [Parabacteroides sp. PF5-5]|uniref:response regulator transcription factor n=1 Tax=unclassified Parabacteroides TaxID=2649774 RepID=UPI0024737963|nr:MULTISPECIES: response regulator transcription factor [unclassified Parabacteroides]MDH6304792.1 DNA-binding response OmpR family regulator [Parabacteroides sp. PH5-39]MDH6315593.1 DNA-binding response OmpR family regulator [Parabacteroides sp. PF5-13]MDH6319254.1 DNA-binding response OmpR family regulator [Parabacteroides sp. PH5-13]MDH6322985.1 DNA-binding response OmpR family regulator [Parabacteroides sp. PH5-8]MDH6326786.1 DNA-binding response OmpR family regulator [Parabacteroides sp.
MREQTRILLFEKNEVVGTMLQEFMDLGNVPASTFSDYAETYASFSKERQAICLISLEDVPDEGFSLARRIKDLEKDVVLIFLGSNPSLETLTKAYEIGADDFVRKPFILEELYMRVLAILRRAYGFNLRENPVYRIGKYTFDTHKQTLVIGDTTIKITTKESDLLRYLCEHMNVLVERESVLRNVWKNNSLYNARSMDVYIAKLRKLLKNDESVSLVNVHGKGYKLLTNI